jgi:hypothetical protein
METNPPSPPEEAGSSYSGAAVAGAVLATLLVPFIALMAALLLAGSQTDPGKRSQLRTWAWVSGAWLVLGVVITVLLATISWS